MSGQLNLLEEVTQEFGPDGRSVRDFYPTHPGLTLDLLKEVRLCGNIWEPCAGTGDISSVIRRYYDNVFETDIHPLRPMPLCARFSMLDAIAPQYWEEAGAIAPVDWVVTNPPFNAALPILQNALKNCRIGCAFLLRLSFLEPTGGKRTIHPRQEFWQKNQDQFRAMLTVSPRPKFRAEGTDSVTVAWFVLDKRWSWQRLGVPCPFRFECGWRENARSLDELPTDIVLE